MFMRLPSSVENQGPTLATLVEVGQVLEEARGEPPLSLSELERRMEAKSTRHSTLRACVDFLGSLGLVTTGSEGVQWTLSPDTTSEPVGYRTDLLDPPETLEEKVRFAGVDPELRGIAGSPPADKERDDMWDTTMDLLVRDSLWKSRRRAALEIYDKVNQPLTQARRHLAENVDYEEAAAAMEKGLTFIEGNPGILSDIGADGEPRFPRYFQTQLRNEFLEVKRALNAGEYDAAIRALDRVEGAIGDRRSQELEALDRAKNEFRKRWHEGKDT